MTNYYINEQRTMPALSRVEGNYEKLSNEPNPVLSEVEWIKQITHLNNEQRTMPALSRVEGNHEQFSNKPNLCRI